MTDTLKIKLQIAAADAINHAEQIYNGKGWVKAPAQSKVCCSLIEQEPHKVIMDILSIWNAAFRAKCNELADAELKAMGVI